MNSVQYRIGTVSFADEARPTWGARSEEILQVLARWGQDGWRISRLQCAPRVALRGRGFCLLLERELEAEGTRRPVSGRRPPLRTRLRTIALRSKAS